MFHLLKFFFKIVTLYNDLFTDSEYKILFQNRSMHFRVIKDQRPKVRLRVHCSSGVKVVDLCSDDPVQAQSAAEIFHSFMA